MWVDIAKITIFLFEEQMSVSWCPSQNGEKILRCHHLCESLEIILFCLVQADPGHDQNDYILLICGNLAKKNGVIVAYDNIICKVKVFERSLEYKSRLAWSVPLKFFFMGIESF